MSHLALVSPSAPPKLGPALAHDIRNALATVALNVETLERLVGPSGKKAASAATALLLKISSFCNDSLRANADSLPPPKRATFDLVDTIRQVIDVVSPTVPAGVKIAFQTHGRHVVFGNAHDVFRIIFNLAHNAITVARASGKISKLTISVDRVDTVTLVRVFDDGPGIPAHVRDSLFRLSAPRQTASNGFGLLIARELAERNGGTLQLVEAEVGAMFVFTLASLGGANIITRHSHASMRVLSKT
jgi:signal transduction histidine kinase